MFFVERLFNFHSVYFVITSEKPVVSNLLQVDKCFWLNWNTSAQSQELLNYFGCPESRATGLAKRMKGFFPCEISFILQLIQSNNESTDKIIQANYPARLEQRHFDAPSGLVGMNGARSQVSHYLNLFLNNATSHCKGLIVYGPTGTGKTLLMRALSQEFFSLGLHFAFVDSSQIRSKLLGSSEKALRDVFERAKSFPRCVLVFDQFKSLFASNRLTGCFLREMDENQQCFVIGVTQRLSCLDEAILRPGRLYPHIQCAELSEAERREFILQPKYPLNLSPGEIHRVLEGTTEFIGAQMNGLMQRAALCALQRVSMESTSIVFDDFLMARELNPQNKQRVSAGILFCGN